MSFKLIEPPLDFTRKTDRTGITAGLIQRQSRPAYCRLTLSPIVLEAVKWEDDTYLAVMVGTGEDAGKVRIAASADGLFRLQARVLKHKMWHLNLGRWRDLPDMTAHAVPCQWRKSGDGQIDIDLPDWNGPGAVSETDDDRPEPEPERLVPRTVKKPATVVASPAPKANGESQAAPPVAAKANGTVASKEECDKVMSALIQISNKLFAGSFDIALPPIETKSGVSREKLPSALSALAANKRITAIPPKGSGKQWHIGVKP